ncbi:hypothetical protein EVAR_101586_1 [Eumeta japonica]|uniref:Uncharacterized protein n=1 Tax=Eumeta variegata TaxID=151549 RepID=A0A4C1TSW9_EUMVA|nr:hypothetical protein EVAR_101586_1 [Eumeta japonica]
MESDARFPLWTSPMAYVKDQLMMRLVSQSIHLTITIGTYVVYLLRCPSISRALYEYSLIPPTAKRMARISLLVQVRPDALRNEAFGRNSTRVVTMVDQASWYRFKSQMALKSYPTEGAHRLSALSDWVLRQPSSLYLKSSPSRYRNSPDSTCLLGGIYSTERCDDS